MTFLRGTSTWGTLSNDVTRLMCGEIADGTTTTLAAGSRWVREVTRSVTDGVLNSTTTVTSATAAFVAGDAGAQVYGTGIPNGATIASVTNGTTIVLSAAATASASGVSLQICTDTIRTPASKDVPSGNMSGRCGYFANVGNPSPPTFMAPAATVARVTNPYTSDPSTSGFHRWAMIFRVSTANSVSGNYSTAVMSYNVYDLDSGVVLTTSSTGTTAGGVVSFPNGLQVTLSDPSGFLPAQQYFARGFTSTYMYGVDLWPFLYRQGATAPAFSVAPPGVAGTDYDIIAQAYPPQGLGSLLPDRSNLLHGLGIKTATANTGALYTVSHPLALIKARIFPSATAGILSLDLGQSKRDAANGLSTFRACGGMRISTWAKMYQTPGSVTAASAVQYWLSITADGIYAVFNADPGQSGKMGSTFLGAFTPNDLTYDVFPVMVGAIVDDFSVANSTSNFQLGTQFSYWALRRHQDASEGRDWQTGWMRCDHLVGVSATNSNYSGTSNSDINTSATTLPGPSTILALTSIGMTSNNSLGNQANAIPARQSKPAPDGKWWLYGMTYAEGNWLSIGGASATTDENRFVRGTLTRYFYIPDSGWGNGDELTDTGTGNKYLLITPDYSTAGERMQSSSGATFQGGIAVAEI